MSKRLEHERHISRHLALHKDFDELLADYLKHNRGASISDSIQKLMEWSHRQTIDPDEP